jgi:hypothetical protein
VTARVVALRNVWDRQVEMSRLPMLGLGVLVACLLTARLLTQPQGIRLAILGVAVVFIIGFGFTTPRLLLYALAVWLPALGIVRRLVNLVSPAAKADPLLLIGPLAIAVLLLEAIRLDAFGSRTTLAKAVAVLNLLMLLGAFNPLQGSLAGGVASLIYVLVPTLAFWIGRVLCDDRTLRTVLKIVAAVAIPEAVYGLFQTLSGFPRWDRVWTAAHTADYQALQVTGVPRAFASFSAASEYGTFLAIAVLVWIAFALRPGLLPIALAAVALLGTAVFYEGSRGTVIAGLVALSMMTAARRGLRLGTSFAVVAVVVLLLPIVVNRIAGGVGGSHSSPLVARQVQGLQEPGNPQYSTLHAHVSLVTDGLRAAIHEPVGLGIGTITVAGAKLGGSQSPTEADPSNIAVALGIPGLIAYAVILVAGLRRMFRVARSRRDPLAVVALGIVVLTTLQWFNGGQYAVAFLPWLAFGWADNVSRRSRPRSPRTRDRLADRNARAF